MSFAPKPSKSKSASVEVGFKKVNGTTSSSFQIKSASLEAHLKHDDGLTTCQPKDVFTTSDLKNGNVELKNGNDAALSASVELSKSASPVASPAVSPAVSLSKSTGSTLAIHAEQLQSAFAPVTVANGRTMTFSSGEKPHKVTFPSTEFINGLSVSAEHSPVVILPCVDGPTLSAPAAEEQHKSAFPAVNISSRDDSTTGLVVAEVTKSVCPAVSVTNGNGATIALAATTEQPRLSVSPAVSVTNGDGTALTLTPSAQQPKACFLGAGLGNGIVNGSGNGSTLSTSTQYTNYGLSGAEQRTRTRTISGLSSRPTTQAIRESRIVIQKEEWLNAARRSTEHFKTCGSPFPLIWVLTEGNNIPDNAVPFGEDRDGYALYIARALLEGSLHIGKASIRSYGAVVGYAGKECIVSNYEVLVFASQLRWGFPPVTTQGMFAQGAVVLGQQRQYHELEMDSRQVALAESDLLRIIRDSSFNVGVRGGSGRRVGGGQPGLWQPQPDQMVQTTCSDEDPLRRLAEIKTVILIDDSLSMLQGNLWEQAREALGGIVDIANQHGSQGADIHFMHWDNYAPNMQSKSEVDDLFSQVPPEGQDTPTGVKLGRIIDHYVPLIEDRQSTHEPIVVVVITDGLPTDQAELDSVIVDVANRLDEHQVKQDMFRIQFVQIGTDPAASKLLHILDDDLVNRYKIRDIVDCTPYDPAQGLFDTEYVLRILLGGLRRDVDQVTATHEPRGGFSSNYGLERSVGQVRSGALNASQYKRVPPLGLTAKLGSANSRPVSPRPVC